MMVLRSELLILVSKLLLALNIFELSLAIEFSHRCCLWVRSNLSSCWVIQVVYINNQLIQVCRPRLVWINNSLWIDRMVLFATYAFLRLCLVIHRRILPVLIHLRLSTVLRRCWEQIHLCLLWVIDVAYWSWGGAQRWASRHRIIRAAMV